MLLKEVGRRVVAEPPAHKVALLAKPRQEVISREPADKREIGSVSMWHV